MEAYVDDDEDYDDDDDDDDDDDGMDSNVNQFPCDSTCHIDTEYAH